MNAPAQMRPRLPQIGMMLHMQPQDGEAMPAFFARRAALVEALEAAGVDAVWVTEHHFDPHSQSASPLLLLAHWAARTRRIQLGVAAVLPAGRNPRLLAEDIALLSNLAPGRVAIGFAKGGPFEAQKRAFGWGSEQARAQMQAVVDAMLALLDGKAADAPAPLQPPLLRPLPMFVASREPETLAWAAQRGLGWMCAQFWPLDTFDAQAVNWGAAARGAADALLVRGLWIDDDRTRAEQHALQWLAAFRRNKQAQWTAGFRGPLTDTDERESLSRMIVGTPADCAAQLDALLAARQVPRLAFNPMHAEPEVQLAQMVRLRDQVLPRLRLGLPATAEPLRSGASPGIGA
ncbi:MAG: LLM class flavin-dependent oxidoreductase [Thiomonas sp.]|jgi:alkanesulfonate monooxygenase SsuD/methylene tetrahydromethanopterin reductase-like flavin-dependent oxidoreductase (luciferase family)